MLAIDLVKITRETLKTLSKIGVKASDYQFIGLYDEYKSMCEKGLKKEYIIAKLTHRHGISKSTLLRVLKRLGECVKI